MITGGHIAISYLIAETSKQFGIVIDGNQILGVVLAGNLPDIDFFKGFFTGKWGENHHQNTTHTPIGILLVWTIILVFGKIQLFYALIILFSMLVHLLLDDLGHILAKLNIFHQTPNPQINWLYPFTQYSKHKLISNNKEVLKHYLIDGWPIAIFEFILIIVATIVFIWS